MGTFGYCKIDIEYSDNAKNEDIKAFIKEISDCEELSVEVKDDNYISISSGRIQNLEYQLGVLESIAEKHECVITLDGSAYEEAMFGIYYDKKEDKK